MGGFRVVAVWLALLCVGAWSHIIHPISLQSLSLDYPDGAVINLAPCKGGDGQKWKVDTTKVGGLIVLESDSKCLDISDYGTSDGSIIWLYSCHTGDTDPNHQNQQWTWDTNAKTIKSTMSGKCMDAMYSGGSIVINSCKNVATQRWTYNSTDHSLRNQDEGLCLTAGASGRPCDVDPAKSLPFCDHTLSLKARVADLVNRIPASNKVGLFGNNAAGVPSLNIPRYQWWSEALHGVAGSPGVSFGGDLPAATSFPQVCLLGATFDTQLWNTIGGVISTEARAFNNGGRAGLTFWTPNLNIFRDPRWGRGQETPGEDPYLTSEYVRYFVRGLQFGTDKNYLKISSCCKHYAAYSLEDYKGMDRHHYNAQVTAQDLADTYFPAFQTCISPDGAASSGIMCSYNSVNGIPSCANSFLLTTEARNAWKFDGYITGDCGAVDDVYSTHKYTATPDATCKAVLEAGMDIDCGGFLPSNLQHAIDNKAVNMSIVDRALTNLFSVQMRLGMYDPVSIQPYTKLGPNDVNTVASQALAEKAAVEGIVLLTNSGALPFTTQKTLAVVGPHAMATNAMQGNYYGTAPFLITPVAGLQAYYKVTYSQGTDISGTNTNGFAAACAAAKAADATVIFIGINQSIEEEGKDRVDITLPGVQNQLVANITGCTNGHVVVVVFAGGAVDLTAIKANNKVSAILWAGYPGQAGGAAVAKIISGTVSPSGRMPYTMHNQDFVNQVSFLDMNMRPNTTTKSPGRTYRFFTGDVVFPFGYGLSYTSFSYVWTNTSVQLQQSQVHSLVNRDHYSKLTAVPLATITATVTNTGKVTSDVSVLCFVEGPQPGVNGNPLRSLVGFKRVFALQPGAKVEVQFPVVGHDLSYTDEGGKLYAPKGQFKYIIEDAVHVVNVV